MNKVKDAKSTAVTFLIVGFLGLALDASFIFGLLPINVDLVQKIMYSSVLGIVFGLFFIVGLVYALSLKKIKAKEEEKENTESELIESFIEKHKSKFENEKSEDDSEEEFFFAQSAKISKLLKKENPDLDDSKIEEYSELIYDKFYS